MCGILAINLGLCHHNTDSNQTSKANFCKTFRVCITTPDYTVSGAYVDTLRMLVITLLASGDFQRTVIFAYDIEKSSEYPFEQNKLLIR